jgi:hypothetical protein
VTMAPLLSASLIALGIACGLLYAGLGIAALRHLPNPGEGDRVYGWTLWWFLQKGRYTPAGQRLCRFGGVTFAVGALAWLAWFIWGRA